MTAAADAGEPALKPRPQADQMQALPPLLKAPAMRHDLFDPRRRALSAGIGALVAAPGLAMAQAPRWKP